MEMWTSVKDRLPAHDNYVPVCVLEDGLGVHMDVAYYNHTNKEWDDLFIIDGVVTHWIDISLPDEYRDDYDDYYVDVMPLLREVSPTREDGATG